MQILESISLDFGRKSEYKTVYAKRYEAMNSSLEISLLNYGESFNLESDVTVKMQLLKPDGKLVVAECTKNYGGAADKILVEFPIQAFAVPGIGRAEIALYRNGSFLSAQKFYMEIEDNEVADAFSSSNEFRALDEALYQVGTVISSAEEAAASATAAALDAENVNIAAVQTARGAEITVTDRDGVSTTVHIDALFAGETWSDVLNAVRQGFAPQLFPVGYEFTTRDSDTNQDIVWVVRGHNHHQAADSGLTRSMTLETKYVYGKADGSASTVMFDNLEALYYAAEELPAGTYNFTVQNRTSYPGDNGRTFKFTLTEPVPAGGQIVYIGAYNQTFAGKNVKTYANAYDDYSSAEIETAAISESTDAASAGTALGATGTNNLNNVERLKKGSNNYAQSDIRQWLNSAEPAVNVWSPRTGFDCKPGSHLLRSGFMHGLPPDFLNVVQKAIVPCRSNNVYETNSLDGTEYSVGQTYNLSDKFFLLSEAEVYGTGEDGSILEYYDGLTDDERRKYDGLGASCEVWLRSPSNQLAAYSSVITSVGNNNIRTAEYDNGFAPACIIA